MSRGNFLYAVILENFLQALGDKLIADRRAGASWFESAGSGPIVIGRMIASRLFRDTICPGNQKCALIFQTPSTSTWPRTSAVDRRFLERSSPPKRRGLFRCCARPRAGQPSGRIDERRRRLDPLIEDQVSKFMFALAGIRLASAAIARTSTRLFMKLFERRVCAASIAS